MGSYPLNIRAFIGFRICFATRFYYPVLAVLFLDYGLTLEEYSLLNVAWAAAIVLLEVPSGALADRIGRRTLVVAAGWLMLAEMLFLLLAPAGQPGVFWFLLANRILSGAAEAAASGADEALAFESLKEEKREGEWPSILSTVLRWQSGAMIMAMLLGAAAYDPSLLNRFNQSLGIEAFWTRALCLRLPALLTLVCAIGAIAQALRLREPPGFQAAERFEFRESWRVMREAWLWIWHRPAVLFLLFYLMAGDSIVRLYLTLGSSYLRLIQIPEWLFGFFGAGMGMLGLFLPKLAEHCVKTRSFAWNATSLALYILACLILLVPAWPYWGLIPGFLTSASMILLGFFGSHYLNGMIEGSNRATLLSFKGLALNLSYGGIGLLYALLLRQFKETGPETSLSLAHSLVYWPWYYAVVTGLLACTARFALSRKSS
jgi:MFS family permease